MREARDLAEHAIVGANGRKIASCMMRGEHRSREIISERRLADSLGPCDQPAMMQPAAPKRILKFGKFSFMADRPLHLSRRGETLKPARLIGKRSSSFRLHIHGLKRSVTASQTSSATTPSG